MIRFSIPSLIRWAFHRNRAWYPSLFRKGAFVTVEQKKDSQDASWVGDVLEIKAVDMPFIHVQKRGDGWRYRVTLDTRQYVFKTLSPEFVTEAIKGELP